MRLQDDDEERERHHLADEGQIEVEIHPASRRAGGSLGKVGGSSFSQCEFGRHYG